jgi:DNA-directed RNA polymerase subunit RPC12/RpoP
MPTRRSEAKQGHIGDAGQVGPKDRQGVFVNAFKCRRCSLEFQLYSWRRDRHKVGQVFCPECGEQTPMLHWRTCVNQSREVGSGEDGAWEIFNLTTRFSDFLLMDDSVVG